MRELLELLGEEFLDDADIPTVATGDFTGVYIEPIKENVNAPCVIFKPVFWRPNIWLPGMGEWWFDINLYDTDQNRVQDTMAHITENYPIPLRHDQIIGEHYRMDELHFLEARTINVSELTNDGGAGYHIPIQAWSVVKKTATISSP